MKRNGSRNCLNRRSRFGSRERDWLREDVKRGCVYLYGAEISTATTTTTSASSDLHLVLCTAETPASEICAGEGKESLYLQLHGDLVRRLEPTERPLQIVYDYLSRLGFDDPLRIQEEATNPDLSCMLRFYGVTIRLGLRELGVHFGERADRDSELPGGADREAAAQRKKGSKEAAEEEELLQRKRRRRFQPSKKGGTPPPATLWGVRLGIGPGCDTDWKEH
ncbi:PH domain leucine-rich repeat-containing protein phosphatase 2 [Galemys pyrenaicus]|uniref:PH domain leucine-rich repeat-containing protein phosphatase 2 n=1 Tax=Galemys pyrenaicus TaxID=202257 RepID=A0A8J6DU74_GALPY|nr:PH domain leucine-rich repeat-containing protein phosphatase 2 [Galemys pyrenaicus]